jgi:hypothetical protein
MFKDSCALLCHPSLNLLSAYCKNAEKTSFLIIFFLFESGQQVRSVIDFPKENSTSFQLVRVFMYLYITATYRGERQRER